MNAVYIAAPFPMRYRIREARDRFTDLGYVVTSTWIDVEPDEEDVSWAVRTEAARQCLREVDAADIFVHVTSAPELGHGGRHVELGYALARGKTVWRAGDKSNIFTALADVAADNLDQLLALAERAS